MGTVSSPFDVLDVDPDADEAVIEKAYRQRILEAHPDHGGSSTEFQRVKAAYEAIRAADTDNDIPANIDTDGSETSPRQQGTHVEYLDYEVLDDHDWSLEDSDLFTKAADAGLAESDYGRFMVNPDETLLEAAENRGFTWPYACRGGACANCAVAVCSGDLSTPVDHILPSEMTDRGIRLSCVGAPKTDDLQVIYNVKHLPDLDELRLPPRPFKQAQADD